MAEIEPLTGEPLPLDLVNTRARLPDGQVDFLSTVRGLKHWLEYQRHQLPTLSPRAVTAPTKPAHLNVLDVRDHAAAAIEQARHGDRPSTNDLRGLNEAMSAAPVTTELVRSKGSLQVASRRHGDHDLHVAAALAEATAALLTASTIQTVRQCEANFCVLLFLPTHPRRRWCSPTVCGNRVRVGRHYDRHKKRTSTSSDNRA